VPGVADPDDRDGRERSLALRDLVAFAGREPQGVAAGLADDDLDVRCLAAAALGVTRAAGTREALERVVAEDPEPRRSRVMASASPPSRRTTRSGGA
jgi:hypothetical protein